MSPSVLLKRFMQPSNTQAETTHHPPLYQDYSTATQAFREML